MDFVKKLTTMPTYNSDTPNSDISQNSDTLFRKRSFRMRKNKTIVDKEERNLVVYFED